MVDMINADISMRAKIISGFFGVYIWLPQSYKATRAVGSRIHMYAMEKNRKKFRLSKYKLNIPSVKNKGKITNIEKIYMYVDADTSHLGVSFLIFSIR